MAEIKLVDGREMARQHPDTLEVPSVADLDELQVGDHARLIFETNTTEPLTQDPQIRQRQQTIGAPSGERMWVKITKRDGDQFTGTLLNDPAFIDGLIYGDEVHFSTEHIVDFTQQ
jgi:uncharacterized protein YegJ (DUF2314 family)